MSHLELDNPDPRMPLATLVRYKRSALLAILVLLLLASPVIDDEGAGGVLLSALFTLVLIAGTLAIGQVRRDVFVVGALSVPWLYLTWLHPVWSGSVLDEVSAVILVICTLYLAGVLLASVVRAKSVTSDVLSGAIAVYFLIGIAWAVIYALIEGLSPGSFAVADASRGTIWDQLLYFSFTTLTTLGYGDIAPLTPVARIWTVFEAICGTLFLAVLVSRLVGLYKA